MMFDDYSSQAGWNTLFMNTVRKYETKYHVSSPHRPNGNPAEGSIREPKNISYQIMHKKKVPKRLWDYRLVWIIETINLSVSISRYESGRTPLEYITGETTNIIEYLDYTFYDWITYRANSGLGELLLGRWLGVSHKFVQYIPYWILPVSGTVTSYTMV